MNPKRLCLLALTCTALSATSSAQFTIFFGEDLGLGEGTPLPASPNADAARLDFISNLANVGTEDFEASAPGASGPLPITFGTAGTATLNGTGTIQAVAPGTTNGFGRYATSGSNFWEATQVFNIDFTQPQAAFGFYGVDIGDFGGQVTLELGLTAGGTAMLTIPNTVNGDGGGILYYGIIADDPANTFDSIQFDNTAFGTDVFAFDDFSIGTIEQLNIGTPYCQAIPNSTGNPGLISATGSTEAALNDLQLLAFQLPEGQFGYFLASPNSAFVPNPGGSQGNLCITSPHTRFVSQAGMITGGEYGIGVDLTNVPQSTGGPVSISAGESWNFTFWYRDSNPDPTSNFTNGVEVLFE